MRAALIGDWRPFGVVPGVLWIGGWLPQLPGILQKKIRTSKEKRRCGRGLGFHQPCTFSGACQVHTAVVFYQIYVSIYWFNLLLLSASISILPVYPVAHIMIRVCTLQPSAQDTIIPRVHVRHQNAVILYEYYKGCTYGIYSSYNSSKVKQRE